MSQFWSQRTKELDPYVPGEQPKDTQYIKLNTNENPYPPSLQVQQAILEASGNDLRLYPDPDAGVFKQAIADYYCVNKSNVFVGNSSDEVLAHSFVALLKHDAPLLFPDISYSFYPVWCGLFGIQTKEIPLDDNFNLNIEDYSIDKAGENGGIIFPNPNAPTGKVLSLENIEQLLQQHPTSVIVIDEAYIDFGAETAIPLTQKYNNLLVVQTLSKSRSLAGLRVGFAIGDKELIAGLERVKNSFHPFPLARNAIAGGTAAINDTEGFGKSCQAIIKTRERTTVELEKLGFSVIPSYANFVFVEPPERYTAEALYLELKENNILVRYFNLPRINKHLRISIGTDEEMDALFQALTNIIYLNP
jgi:histidinol-phosphate aminotransferase